MQQPTITTELTSWLTFFSVLSRASISPCFACTAW